MLDPRELYEIDDEVAAQVPHAGTGTGPVLVHALRGFVDAGAAGRLAVEHVLGEFDSARLVTFDADQLVDYRSRRPTMTFDSRSWTSYDEPVLAVDLVRDGTGVPFLLLHGHEPDVQWERWTAAVLGLVERLEVPLTVGLHGIPMGVPHTRPTSATAHATRSALIADHTGWIGTVQVPAAAGALLELRLGESGHDAMGFAVHVPHYLAQASYPTAAVGGLELVERATGLDLHSAALLPAAEQTLLEIERQVGESGEVADVVHALENQYDAFVQGVGKPGLLAGSGGLPTAEELGAEFERFLAQQGGDGAPPTRHGGDGAPPP